MGTLVYLLLGPIAWAMHLMVVYGSHTLICAREGGSGASETILAATLIVLAMLAAAIAAPGAAQRALDQSDSNAVGYRFHRRVMRWLAFLSAVGVAWAGSTALIVGPCLSLR